MINKSTNNEKEIAISSIGNGQVILVDFGKNEGSVQSGIRPAVVIQNDVGNKHSPTTIVLPLTKASNNKHNIPTHYQVDKSNYKFLDYDSIVLGEQILTISKKQIKETLGFLNEKDMKNVNKKLLISIGLSNLQSYCI